MVSIGGVFVFVAEGSTTDTIILQIEAERIASTMPYRKVSEYNYRSFSETHRAFQSCVRARASPHVAQLDVGTAAIPNEAFLDLRSGPGLETL